MDLGLIAEAIATLGFPIAICVALFWFIYQVYKKSESRETELRQEIKENQETNKEAIKTLALYAERLDSIQTDVNEIKQVIITTHHE
jgi:Na+/melibiose symporter-like transporter